MDQFGVQLALEDLREVKRVWMKAKRDFDAQWMDSFIRLLHEAAINYMSVDQVSKASGLTRRRIRSIMRDHGLDPKRTKTVLSKTAAEAVQNNAAQLGVKPDQISLLSPLAYLPLGSEAPTASAEPTPLPVPLQELVGDFQTAWHGADRRGEVGSRSEAGVLAVLWKLGYDTESTPTETITDLSEQDTKGQDLPEGDGRVGWINL